MAAIEARAAATLQPGTVCITLTKHFKGDAWEVRRPAPSSTAMKKLRIVRLGFGTS
jgi:hypothetical protein